MPRLDEEQRWAAVTMLMNGSSQFDVTRHFRVHKSTISRLYNRLRTTGTTNDRPRPDRPHVTTRRDDAFIRLTHLRHRFKTPEETVRNLRGPNNDRLCARTVSNMLRRPKLERDGHT